jgi:hypothetical protein
MTFTHQRDRADAAKAGPAGVRMSYLLGRWAQAPISHPVREADT